jgi:B12-binding domain/radical SAM domain protein of rhizo-twelve system
MNIALINPRWSFEGSIYFGCREPHLPLEFGYAKALLERDGHNVRLIDCHLHNLSLAELRAHLSGFRPSLTAITTAPTYLFWRCAPPELRVPFEAIQAIRDVAGTLVAVGPHASTTPQSALRKLSVDAVVLGECEEVLPPLARAERSAWAAIPSICYWQDAQPRVQGSPHAADMAALPALEWPSETVVSHSHHHHRFDDRSRGAGAEMEVSRGCPYHCTFCAKDNFRDRYRKRPLQTVLQELDSLLAQRVQYVYFVDEIFLPDAALLEELARRPISFGVQTRIDLWKPEMLDLLGRAGCVSIEAGVESITRQGRELLDKSCRLSTEELAERLIHAKRSVPFVQANLLESPTDDLDAIRAWREHLARFGVWANEPVPLFPYPGSPEYTRRWGPPDDRAWERALDRYLDEFSAFSDLQDARPLRLAQLEAGCPQPGCLRP